HLGPDDFLLPPLPNHLFQRDNSAWVYDGVSVNPMAKQARRRETLNSRVVYNFHPMFTAGPMRFLYGNDSAAHETATIEGGDITVIGHRAVMIGMGERSTPQGIEILARSLFRAGTVDTVLVVELPHSRAFMHLDTVMTMVDKDAFCLFPYLPDTLRSFTLTRLDDAGELKVGVLLDLELSGVVETREGEGPQRVRQVREQAERVLVHHR
ncbi:arginine deiminase family protein, partial [Streptomyces rhizosphaericus]|uniref:arginine deiminase family protein n=1 Tax=Streptomyces rhizosphaericus TaxID=114699 RepID=UPI0031D61DB4